MNEEVKEAIDQIRIETDIFIKAKLLENLKKKGVRITDLAKMLGIKPSYICHILRLNRLPEIIVDGYYSKLISLSHLFIVSRIKDEKKVSEVYEKIVVGSLTVGQTEELIREVLHHVTSGGDLLSKEEKKGFVQGVVANDPDLKVDISQTRIRGRLIIEIKGNPIKSTKILRRLMEKIKVNETGQKTP